MNVKEAAEQLTFVGISANSEKVLQWIKEGKIKAEVYHRRNTDYKINLKDLTEFIIQKRTLDLTLQLQESQRINEDLTEQVELLKTRVHIEQSKVRTLKKLLNFQIEKTGTTSFEELLGVGQDQNKLLLKKEFKKLLKALHPDRGGDERLFKVFNEHYKNIKEWDR